MESNVATQMRALDGPVLITGHTGFKGTWLTRYLLKSGIEVVGYSLPPKETDLYTRAGLEGAIDEQFSDIRSITDLEAFVKRTKPQAIFHLAAQPLVLESYREPLSTFETNVMGTANLLEVARNSNSVQAVIVVTTDKVYQNLDSGIRFKETDPLLGADPYSASKVGAENVAIAWQQLPANGVESSISVVRSGNVVGGGDLSDDRLLADVVRARISGRKFQIRNPQSTRPWQHVLDPLNGYVMAMEKALKTSQGDSFNFGPSEPALEVAEVIKVVQELWKGVNFEIVEPEKHPYESKLLDLNSDHARNTLSWFPKYSQREAIIETLSWWDEVIVEKRNVLNVIDSHIQKFFT
jgi:CDP-glucose 4,6-dehydratase